MKRSILVGLFVFVLISVLTSSEGWSQYTQGPPGNPSAAGIMSGTPAPSGPQPRAQVSPMPPQGGMPPLAMGIPYATPDSGGIGAYLGLTHAQFDKLRDLRTRFYRESRDLRYDYFQKQLEMRKLFADPKVAESRLMEKEKELSPIRQKLMDKVAQTIIEGRKVLTPEQMEKLDQLPLWYPGIDIGPDLGFLSADMPMSATEY